MGLGANSVTAFRFVHSKVADMQTIGFFIYS
jgi:hypothetical protein